MDNPLSPEKTDVSEAEAMSNSENKDNVEHSSNEEVPVSKDTQLEEPELAKNPNEEISDETVQETVAAVSEKDSPPSNVDTSDSATCSTTPMENVDAEAKVPSPKEIDTVVTMDETNVAENFSEESTSVHADKATTELSAPDLTEKCHTEHSANDENLLGTTTQEPANDENLIETTTQEPANDENLVETTMQEPANVENLVETTMQEPANDENLIETTMQEPANDENLIETTTQEPANDENLVEKTTQEPANDKNLVETTTQEPANDKNLVETTTQEPANDKNLLETTTQEPDNIENDEAKSASENIANELEAEVSTESNKDCDPCMPDESSVNAEDVQMPQKDVDSAKKVDSESDSNSENPDKDSCEKNEPENTEFVQFSHEKHDDPQIENQSMDAVDPFGGDNLTSENVEQMETDGLAEDAVSFKNLLQQADNLQHAVNVRNDEQDEKLSDECTLQDGKDIDKPANEISEASGNIQTSIDSLENTPMDTDVADNSTAEMETASTSSSAKLSNEQSKPTKKSMEEITPMETDEEQAEVLPGQDDELCIIPDSMKVIIPNKSAKAKDGEQSESTLEKDSKTRDEAAQKKPISELDGKDPTQDKPETTTESGRDNDSENTASTQNEKSAPAAEDVSKAADVINIDDESKNSEVEEITTKETCKQCREERACKIRVKIGTENYHVCSKTCKALFKAANNKAVDIPSDGASSKCEKRCATCSTVIETNDERNLSWETMEYCNEECLGKFQRKYGSFCKNCNGTVQAVSLGKYCVRFGCDVRQFCCSTCLEEFKKGLKVCSYCQKDISFSTDGFLAPVGEKGQFKDFCTQDCMEKYSKLNSTEPPATEKKLCSVCKQERLVYCEIQIQDNTLVVICSEVCLAAFKFVNKQVNPEQCSTCKKFFELPKKQSFGVFYENEPHIFCNKTCLNIFIITNRKIVPCNWCKVKKYNFDMIKKELKTGQVLMMCSLNCLTLYQVSINAVSAKRINCDFCKEYSLAHYHLTMSDATIRNFCSYHCVMNFQAQYTKSPITIPSSDDPVPTGAPKKVALSQRVMTQTVQKSSEIQGKKIMPVISSVTSLAAIGNGQATPNSQQNSMVMSTNAISNQPSQVIYKQQVITRPPTPPKIHNKMVQCKPLVHTKGVSVRPHPCTKWTQTTEKPKQAIVPIPVPIFVPFPMHMYSMPFPVPMPFPLPIPVPLFIPTTRNSAKGIMKDIKKIQEKIPADPYEAELLMMAEMVATEKKADSDSDSVDEREGDTAEQDNLHSDGFSPEAVDSSNTFGDDMLQMALKMATGELDEPAVDLEAALTPNTITATQAPAQTESSMDNDVQSERLMGGTRGRKRGMPYKPRSTPTKRVRRVSGTNDMPLMPPPEPQPPPQPRIMEPMEKPDANLALKYTFGVNAWRQWVIGKNAELEKQITPTRKIKLFKTDLLQLTADELNYSLCLFVKEVRKPNGAEYAPDTIFYLCLGIQQYLFENNRIDNIFTDSYYEKFTDCLNEVAKKFSVLYNDAQYIVTRVEEEHLWECKQLGAHSPHVLLSTLMFFNTKHFNLVTVEEHMQLSFSHIMKHWKRNPAAQPTAVAGKVPGSRNVLLRFYPPQSALANSRKKKVYEQQENEENPLRCPVKLYEFYLSKCPESVKTRNDVFYLLPERSCVPDSPVWYSTSPLAKEHLVKMLHRIKMVKEINVALLTS